MYSGCAPPGSVIGTMPLQARKRWSIAASTAGSWIVKPLVFTAGAYVPSLTVRYVSRTGTSVARLRVRAWLTPTTTVIGEVDANS